MLHTGNICFGELYPSTMDSCCEHKGRHLPLTIPGGSTGLTRSWWPWGHAVEMIRDCKQWVMKAITHDPAFLAVAVVPPDAKGLMLEGPNRVPS